MRDRSDQVADEVADALADLAFAQTHDQTLAELEVAADAGGEAVPDRAAASFVVWALRAAGAARVVELGAGRGALSWWLAGATALGGELHVVTDPPSAPVLTDRLRRAGRFGHVTVHGTGGPDDPGLAPTHLAGVRGELDAVVVARPTEDLVRGWDDVVDRVRPGGVLVVGEVLRAGIPTGAAGTLVRGALEDPELWASVVPLGDGWLVALKARADLGGAAAEGLW